MARKLPELDRPEMRILDEALLDDCEREGRIKRIQMTAAILATGAGILLSVVSGGTLSEKLGACCFFLLFFGFLTGLWVYSKNQMHAFSVIKKLHQELNSS